jgi:hypothetical protein
VRRGLKIVGANHTDPQDPAGVLSVITCGTANSTRQALYRRYMAGWFEYHLRGDGSYAPWILNYPGGQLAADLAANRITYRAVVPLGLAFDGWSSLDAGCHQHNARGARGPARVALGEFGTVANAKPSLISPLTEGHRSRRTTVRV